MRYGYTSWLAPGLSAALLLLARTLATALLCTGLFPCTASAAWRSEDVDARNAVHVLSMAIDAAGNPAFAEIGQGTVVPILMKEFLPPFMLGVVFIGAIAAMHSTAAPYIGTGGSILLRDIWWR